MKDNVVTFPGVKAGPTNPEVTEKVSWRARNHVQGDIDAHIETRRRFAAAVAWEIATVDQNLPEAQIGRAREQREEA